MLIGLLTAPLSLYQYSCAYYLVTGIYRSANDIQFGKQSMLRYISCKQAAVYPVVFNYYFQPIHFFEQLKDLLKRRFIKVECSGEGSGICYGLHKW